MSEFFGSLLVLAAAAVVFLGIKDIIANIFTRFTYSKSDSLYALYKREKAHSKYAAKESKPVNIPVKPETKQDDNGKEDVISFEDITIRFTPPKQTKTNASPSPSIEEKQSEEFGKKEMSYAGDSSGRPVTTAIRREPIAKPVRLHKHQNRKKKREAGRLNETILNASSPIHDEIKPVVKSVQFQNQSNQENSEFGIRFEELKKRFGTSTGKGSKTTTITGGPPNQNTFNKTFEFDDVEFPEDNLNPEPKKAAEIEIEVFDRFKDLLVDSESADTEEELPPESLVFNNDLDENDSEYLNRYTGESVGSNSSLPETEISESPAEPEISPDTNYFESSEDPGNDEEVDDASLKAEEEKQLAGDEISDIVQISDSTTKAEIEHEKQDFEDNDTPPVHSEAELTETIVRSRVETDENIISDFVQFNDDELRSKQQNEEEIQPGASVALNKQPGSDGLKSYIHFEDIFDGSSLPAVEPNPPNSVEINQNETNQDSTGNYINLEKFFAEREMPSQDSHSQHTSIELREPSGENGNDNLIQLEAVSDGSEVTNATMATIDVLDQAVEIREENFFEHDDNNHQNHPAMKLPGSTEISVPFRNQPEQLYSADVEEMINNYNFYDRLINPKGSGLPNRFIFLELNQNEIVIDESANLMWQRNGSAEPMNFDDATQWIESLNRDRYAGFDDWRLPTLEEAMSLMEQEPKNSDLYIDPLFGKIQQTIWTNDYQQNKFQNWMVSFSRGFCGVSTHNNYNFVRAVRHDEKPRSDILV